MQNYCAFISESKTFIVLAVLGRSVLRLQRPNFPAIRLGAWATQLRIETSQQWQDFSDTELDLTSSEIEFRLSAAIAMYFLFYIKIYNLQLGYISSYTCTVCIAVEDVAIGAEDLGFVSWASQIGYYVATACHRCEVLFRNCVAQEVSREDGTASCYMLDVTPRP